MKPNPPAAIETVSLTKTYEKTDVVRGVSITALPGEIVGIVGPNGSGKSTLFNMLSGLAEPDSGYIAVEQRRVNFGHPEDAIDAGIAMLAQYPDLCPELTVAENIFLGREPRRSGALSWLTDWQRLHHDAAALLREAGNSEISPSQAAGTLSGGQKKAVTLARLIGRRAKVVLLDEPTASLADRQKEATLSFAKKCKMNGAAVLIITHDRKEVNAVCDRVIAMQRGFVVGDFPVQDDVDSRLTDLMNAT